MNTKTSKNGKNDQLHVVLGVSGNIGRFVAKELVSKGYTVRGVSRSGNGPQNIKTVKADALNLGELKEALSGASVIYHCLGIPYSQWEKCYPVIMNNLIESVSMKGNGNKSKSKIVFADNLYAFGEKGAKIGPMSEDTPQLAQDKKGRLRKKIASMLFEADKEGKIIAVVGKGSDIFGPEATNSMFEVFLRSKILNNRPAEIFANLDALHSYIYVKDFARSLVTLGIHEKANGKSWVLPHYEAISIEEFITQFYEVASVDIPKKVKTRPFFFLKLAGLFSKEIREYEKMTYQMKNDWVVDDTKFRSTFTEFESTPLEQAFNETYEWYKENKN